VHFPVLAQTPVIDFEALFNASPIALLALEPAAPDYRILAATDAYARQVGLERKQLVGRPAGEVLTDSAVLQSVEAAVRERREQRVAGAVSDPVLGQGGAVLYVVYRPGPAEAALREREDQNASIFERVPLAIALTRIKDNAIVQANPAFFRLIEFTPEEVLGRPSVDVGISSAASNAVVAEEMRKHGAVRELELKLRSRSGAERTVSLDLDLVTINGERHALAMLRDLTDFEGYRDRLMDLDAMQRLHRVSTLFLEEDNEELLLQMILDEAIAIAEADSGVLGVVTQPTGALEIVAHRALPPAWVDFVSRWAAGRTYGQGAAFEPRTRYIIEDVAQIPVLQEGGILEVERAAGVRALTSTPLISRTGAPVGLIIVHYKTPRRPADRALPFLDLLARQAADILERLQAAAALRTAEARSSGILASSADAIISVDAAHRITLWSDGAECMFGYTRAEVLGAGLDQMVPQRLRGADPFGLDAPTRPAQARVMTALRKDGTELPVSAITSQLEVDGERIYTVSLRDISDEQRRQIETRTLADAGAALASLSDEAALHGLVEMLVTSLADFATLYVLDGDELRRVAAASREPDQAWAAEALTGEKPELMPDGRLWNIVRTQRPLLYAPTPEEYAARVRTPEQLKALEALRPKGAVGVPLMAGTRCLGVLFIASSLRTFDARDLELMQEISRRCALFIQNAALHRSEKRAIQMRDEVLSIVAHDLRTPLSVISLHAALLKPAPSSADRRSRRPAEAIELAAKRMNRIIQDLLDVSRLEAGRLSLERERVEPNELLAEVIAAHRAAAEAKGVELACVTVDNLPAVWADGDRIAQVLENLVANALKFTSAGRITLSADAATGVVRFNVTDTGIGIPPEHVPHVFDWFWQAKRATRIGAGLGLAIVKGLVEAHGGAVSVTSTVGLGSTFSFTVPVVLQSERPLPAAPRAARKTDLEHGPLRRVILAEDDLEMRTTLTDVLHHHGYSVEGVDNGAEVLEKLRQASELSVVILDLGLPVMDGWQVLAEREKDPALRRVPVIVISGQRNVEERVASAHARWVGKPILASTLLEAMRDAESNTPEA
jgi:PAS domain S-box-containing protein